MDCCRGILKVWFYSFVRKYFWYYEGKVCFVVLTICRTVVLVGHSLGLGGVLMSLMDTVMWKWIIVGGWAVKRRII